MLHRATQKGNLLVVEQKLDAMSNGNKTYPLDAKDQDGRSVVHLACLLDIDNNAEPMLEKLISHGANVNCRDESGNTPLHVIIDFTLQIRSLIIISLIRTIQMICVSIVCQSE